MQSIIISVRLPMMLALFLASTLPGGETLAYFRPLPPDGMPPGGAFAQVRQITTGGLVAAAGIRVGDRIAGVDGMAVNDARDLCLIIAQLPLDCRSVQLQYLRDGQHRTATITATILTPDLGWRLINAPEPAGDFVAAAAAWGLPLDADQAFLIRDLPARFAGMLYAARPAAPPATTPGWLAELTADYLALATERFEAVGSHPSGAPLPELRDLHDHWRRLARFLAAGGMPDDLATLGADPAYLAFTFPHPHLPKPPLGTPPLEPVLLDLLGRMRDDARADRDARLAYCQRLATLPDPGLDFLQDLRRALVADWQYSHHLATHRSLTDEEARDRLRQRLAGLQDGADAVLARAGEIIVAVAADAPTDAAAALGRLADRSPYLAWRVHRLAIPLARHLVHQPTAVLRALEEVGTARQLTARSRLEAFYAACAERHPDLRPLLATQNLSRLDGVSRTLLDDPLPFCRAVTPDWPRMLLARRGDEIQADTWQAYALARATDARFLDLAEATFAAERIWELVGRSAKQQHLVALAAGAAAGGDFATAVAILKPLANQAGSPGLLTRQLAAYRRGELGVESLPLLTSEHDDGHGMTWQEVAGERFGPCRIARPGGGLCAEGGLFAGQAAGCWRYYHDDGRTLKSEGRMWRDCRLGRWRHYHPDGTLESEGSYDGSSPEARTGMWTSFHPNGRRAMTGFWHRGRRYGEHLSWHDNGQLASRGTYQADRIQGIELTWDREGGGHDPSLPESPGVPEF
jgi:hypothetical protein